jgi:hypothetical protein
MTDQYMELLAKNYPESTTKVVKLQIKLMEDCYQHFRHLQFLLETIHEPAHGNSLTSIMIESLRIFSVGTGYNERRLSFVVGNHMVPGMEDSFNEGSLRVGAYGKLARHDEVVKRRS